MIRVRAKTIDGEYWQPETKRNRAVPIGEQRNQVGQEGWFFLLLVKGTLEFGAGNRCTFALHVREKALHDPIRVNQFAIQAQPQVKQIAALSPFDKVLAASFRATRRARTSSPRPSP